MEPKIVRKYIICSGRVQGVGFRYHATNLAMEYHLSGWVRNCSNGTTVEMEVQGREADVDRFAELLGENTHWIRIDYKSVTEQQTLPDERGFRVRY